MGTTNSAGCSPHFPRQVIHAVLLRCDRTMPPTPAGHLSFCSMLSKPPRLGRQYGSGQQEGTNADGCARVMHEIARSLLLHAFCVMRLRVPDWDGRHVNSLPCNREDG